MVKKKLNVLSQAGLNKSNFDDTENHEKKKPAQNSILHYFQVSVLLRFILDNMIHFT